MSAGLTLQCLQGRGHSVPFLLRMVIAEPGQCFTEGKFPFCKERSLYEKQLWLCFKTPHFCCFILCPDLHILYELGQEAVQYSCR